LIEQLAPTLREQNLRILIALAHHFGHTRDLKGQASSKQLVAASGLSRSNVQTAIDELTSQRLTTATGGTATTAATYTLEFIRTALIGAPIPGPTSIDERASGLAPIDLISSSTDPINRMLHAKPKHFEPAELTTAKRLIHGYQLKFGRNPNPHLPDDEILAQFLAVAPWPELNRLICNELKGQLG
jgi:hypothetical protein